MSVAAGRPEDLPDFRNPPLTETVLSLQFQPIDGLTGSHVGLLWQRFRQRLPLVEEHPPLQPVIETFDLPSPKARINVTIEEKPPLPRVWFLNEGRTELIQVQADRLIHNWRRMRGREPYPRFEPIRDRFRDEVEEVGRFLQDEGLGSLVVNQCEVTYLNHIESSDVWETHGQMERILRLWSPWHENAFLPQCEDAAVRLRFVIPSEEGKPVGRLHVALQPAWKKADKSPILTMNLTVRGAPLGRDIESAFAFFELGRRWIVKGFADLTTTTMQRAWERTDV